MTEGHIHNAAISKVLQVLYFFLNGKAVFYTQKDTLLANFLILDDIFLCLSQGKAVGCTIYDLSDFIEDTIRIFLWRTFIIFLGDISHHNSGILVSLCHFGKVNENV